ncbi:MAG: hypothetical protein WCB04_09815 [Mycobacteriales bacterium]
MRPASDAIDWTDLGERIGDRSKPLGAPTMRRIHAGIDQFAVPTVISTNHDDGDRRSYPAHAAPMPTKSTKIGDGVACPPFLLDHYQYDNTADRRFVHDPASSPMTTVTANGRSVRTLVTPRSCSTAAPTTTAIPAGSSRSMSRSARSPPTAARTAS